MNQSISIPPFPATAQECLPAWQQRRDAWATRAKNAITDQNRALYYCAAAYAELIVRQLERDAERGR